MSEERIALLRKFIEEEPENPFNQYALAMELYEKIPEEACRILANLSQDKPNYLPTYFKLAHLYWDFEEWDKAQSIFERGIILASKQDDQKALRELKSAFQNFEFERD